MIQFAQQFFDLAQNACELSDDDSGQWYRSYGNENWEFDENGLTRQRFASINDVRIGEAERKFRC